MLLELRIVSGFITKLSLHGVYSELLDKGIKNEQKRTMNGGGAIHGSLLLILGKKET